MKLLKALSCPLSRFSLVLQKAGRAVIPSIFRGGKQSIPFEWNLCCILGNTHLTHTSDPHLRTLIGTGKTAVERGWWTLPRAGLPSCWHFSGPPHPWDIHGALARLLNHGLDPYFWQSHKLLLCTAKCQVNLDIWFPLTGKLTHQLNSDIFYVSSYARFSVFQAHYSTEEFGFTGSGVSCKLFTVSISLTELGSNSCVHLSEIWTGRRGVNQRKLTWPSNSQELLIHFAAHFLGFQ